MTATSQPRLKITYATLDYGGATNGAMAIPVTCFETEGT